MIKRNGILKGAVILTAAGFITRALGFVYRIYMSKAVGAEGMGLYQLILPLYTLAWSISCSGITTTVSKLVAAENAKKQYGNMGRVVRIASALTLGLGLLTASALFIGADFLSVKVLGDPRTAMSIKILSAAVPFMAVGSGLRGYFTGLSQMQVPAVSQVLEQVVRMAVIVIASGSMFGRGLEYACAACVIGVVAEEAASFIYVMYKYNSHRMKWAFNSRTPDKTPKVLLGMITAMALPLTLNRITGSLLSSAESVLIPRSLQQFGMSQAEAISAFGRVSGMAMPLIFFPSALLVSLSTSIVPAVAEAFPNRKLERLSGTLSKSFLLTSLIGIGAAAVFAVFAGELGMAVYSQDIGQILLPLAFICPLWYFNITLGGVLNGLGAMSNLFLYNFISSAINIACIVLFVPVFGITAFVAGWFAGVAVQVLLGAMRIRKDIKIKFPIPRFVLKPALAAAASGLSVKVISARLIFPFIGDAAGLIASVALVAALYIMFSVMLGVVETGDIRRALNTFLFFGRKKKPALSESK